MIKERLLKGAYDLHVHTAPDISKRKFDDYEFCERLIEANMNGGLIKNHYTDTSARATLLNKKYPNLKMAGGLVLNNSVGGLNPEAVKISAKLGGKIVWMPTMDALAYQKSKTADVKAMSKFISIIDEKGKLKDEVYEILDIAYQNKMFVATGHISSKEGLELIRVAYEKGVKTIVTHADNPANLFTIEEQKEAVSLGALIEHAYFTVYHNKVKIEDMVNQIKEIGSENIYLTTDFGQMNSPYPEEGLLEFIQKLMDLGIKEEEIRKMIVVNPEYIISFRD